MTTSLVKTVLISWHQLVFVAILLPAQSVSLNKVGIFQSQYPVLHFKEAYVRIKKCENIKFGFKPLLVKIWDSEI